MLAGPHVRAACARHLRDLKKPPKDGQGRPFRWDVSKVDRVLGFFSTVLRLNGGEHEGVPFKPEPWQAFVLGSLFGWVDRDGYRRFRVAFVEGGKGCGKSPLSAGIGLYMLMADGEARAEVYAAAVDREQASILFRDAVAMAKMSEHILPRITFSGGEGKEHNIAYHQTGSFFRPVSSESSGRGKSGFRPHCVLLDEIHEHPTNAMVEFMRAGTKGRRQALIFMITNSGVDRTSVCYEYHQYGAEVAAGDRKDESFFSFICAVDEDDDPFTDPVDPKLGYPPSWQKSNPSIGVTFGPRYLQEQVDAAKGMPSKESIVRRLNFCQWVDASNPWIDGDLWRKCEVEDWVQPEGPCFLGLDLSSKRDLTALAAVWPVGDELHARLWFWTPRDTMTERENSDRVPYRAWVNADHLIGVEGRLIDYHHVAEHVASLDCEIAGLAYDKYKIDDFLKAADAIGLESYIWDGPDKPEGEGLRLIRHGQGFADGAMNDAILWMNQSVEALERAVVEGKLKVQYNPVLRWNSASAVLEPDATGNRKWEKRKSTGRIDGIVALCMAIGAATSTPPEADYPDVFFV